MSWGSLFQTEVAATTKARSPKEEWHVAEMAGKDDTAERRCFRLGRQTDRARFNIPPNTL